MSFFRLEAKTDEGWQRVAEGEFSSVRMAIDEGHKLFGIPFDDMRVKASTEEEVRKDISHCETCGGILKFGPNFSSVCSQCGEVKALDEC